MRELRAKVKKMQNERKKLAVWFEEPDEDTKPHEVGKMPKITDSDGLNKHRTGTRVRSGCEEHAARSCNESRGVTKGTTVFVLALVMLVFFFLLREESVRQTPGLQVLHREKTYCCYCHNYNNNPPRLASLT